MERGGSGRPPARSPRRVRGPVMNRNPSRRRRRDARTFHCENLEGRALLSGLGPNLPPHLATALIGKVKAGAIKADPAGISAITSALHGGPGNEFVTLLRHQLSNPG